VGDEPMLLTEKEAADRLRLCARTLRKERQAGRLHFVQIGRSIRYSVSDLEAFIAACRVPASSEVPMRRARPIIPFSARP
jgi:excisionase family DNA binding protein